MKSYFYIFIMILCAYSIQTNAQKIIVNTNSGTTVIYNLKAIDNIDFTNNLLTVTLYGGTVESYHMDSLSSYLYDDLDNTVNNTKLESLPIQYLNSFPNPNNGVFTINYVLKKETEITISIYDLKGNVVFTSKQLGLKGEHNESIELAERNIGSGIYIIELTTASERFIDKLIINK